MNTKHPLKSKTILFALITILAAIFNLVNPGEKPIAQMTWKELQQQQGQQVERVADLLVLLGGGGAIYGRVKAKDKIGGKDDE